MRDNGLVVSNMNVSYRGATNIMYDNIIEEVGGYAGMMEISNTQTMSFNNYDAGPFWMDPIEKLANKNMIESSMATYQ